MAETEISKLKIGFQLDSSQLDKGMGHVLSNLNLMQKEFKTSMIGVDKFGGSFKDLGKEAEGLKGILNQQKIALASIQAQYDKTSEAQRKNEEKLKDLRKQYQQAVKDKSLDEQALKNLEKEINSTVYAMKKQEKELTSLHGKYIDMTGNVKKTELALADVEKRTDEAKFSFSKLSKSVGDSSKGLLDIGLKLNAIPKTMGKVILSATKMGLALTAAIGTVAVKNANDVVQSSADLYAQLDITKKQAEEYGKMAKNIWKDGFGESVDEVTLAIVKASQTLRQLKPDELEDVTKKALTLSHITGADLQESLRGINGLMVNFGLSSDEAFDYMVKGVKKGLNVSNELEDNIAEYSQIWAQSGFSAKDMFEILDNGLKSGAYNLDKVNDFVKEFTISLNDGRIAKNIGSFSEKSKELFNAYKDGKASAKDVMGSIIHDLEGMKDKQEKLTLAGTVWSALGEDNAMKVIESLNNTSTAFDDVKGSADDVIDALGNTPMAQFTSAWRDFQTAFVPIGTELLKLATEKMPDVKKAISEFADLIKNIDWQAFIDKVVEIKDTVLPPLQKAFDNIWGILKNLDDDTIAFGLSLGALSVVIGPAISIIGGLGKAFSLLLTPVGGIIFGIGAIIGLIYWMVTDWEGFVDTMSWVAEMTAQALGDLLLSIGNFFAWIGEAFFGFLEWLSGIFDEMLGAAGDFIAKFGEWFGNAFYDLIEATVQFFIDLGTNFGEGFWNLLEAVGKFFYDMGVAFGEAWDSIVSSVGTFFLDLGTGFGEGFLDLMGDIGGWIDENIISLFEDIDLFDIGANIIEGLADGIMSLGDWIKGKIEEIGEKIPEWLMKLLGIHSPSRVLRDEVGQWIPKGIAVGIEGNIDSIEDATLKMAKASIPNIGGVNIPQSATNGVYGGTQTNNTFSPTVNVNASSPYEYAVATQRMLRRMKFQEGI